MNSSDRIIINISFNISTDICELRTYPLDIWQWLAFCSVHASPPKGWWLSLLWFSLLASLRLPLLLLPQPSAVIFRWLYELNLIKCWPLFCVYPCACGCVCVRVLIWVDECCVLVLAFLLFHSQYIIIIYMLHYYFPMTSSISFLSCIHTRIYGEAYKNIWQMAIIQCVWLFFLLFSLFFSCSVPRLMTFNTCVTNVECAFICRPLYSVPLISSGCCSRQRRRTCA